MKKNQTTTLLISTYNWPEALELVLLSVKNQSILPTEIIIADDGSTVETKNLIEKYQQLFTTPIIHVWHEDIGFAKTIILNKALKKVTSDYIIQIDGDVILHKHFVKDHISYSEENVFLFGSRTSLKKEYSKKVLKTKKIKFNWFNNGILRKSRAIYIPFYSRLSKKYSTKISSKLRGCNISYWKKDAVNINGYNEDFIGWGYEDSEFAQRLLNSGVTSLRIKQVAIQYHIYHPEAPKGNTEIGDAIITKTSKENIVRCKNGIKKYNLFLFKKRL